MRFIEPNYIEWFLEKTDEVIKLDSGEVVSVFRLAHLDADARLNEWAKHILRHYRTDAQIQKGADKNCGGDVSKYITEFIIKPTVPKDISGDFGEFVFSDFLEYVLKMEVPRYKKLNTYPSNPTQGIDIFGFRLTPKGNEVFFMEIKSRLAKKEFKVLCDAISDSISREDTHRALALEHARLFYDLYGDSEMEDKITLLQSSEKPPKRTNMAGIITSAKECKASDFAGIKIQAGKQCKVYAIYGSDLWTLAQKLYERACL